MDNAATMRFIERVGDFHPNLENLVDRQRPFWQSAG